MRIVHTGDVHVRGLSRHSEYKAVFEQMIAEARKHGTDAFMVTGDIFHTKTSGITPEYIDFMRWWLTSLAEVAPVHMILGNHDGNLSNATRQDAVSPIVAALQNPRVHLYKKSGAYEFSPGFVWCVYSLFDKEGWNEVKPVEGKINIACYHGPVRSSVTETGWSIDDGPSVDFFSGYDAVLLGDIHRAQFLGYRESNGTKKGWIGYPSTPVCQNYAEGFQPHGYFLWDIRGKGDWDVEFRELRQPNPFITVDWKGSLESFKEDVKLLPKASRFRIRSDVYISQEELQHASDHLRFQKNALEVVTKLDKQHVKDVFSAGGLEMMRDDLRNLDVQMLLLRDFYRDQKVSLAEWDEISARVARYLQQATAAEDSPRHAKWTVKGVGFDNLFTYGKDNLINFEKLTGIVGIFGPNRCGKSSIVGSLMYGLFNATDRGSIPNVYVVNARKGYGEARISIDVNGTGYSITRETSKSDTRKGKTVAATSLSLERTEPDGSSTPLDGEQRSDTEKVIRKLIGTQEDFMLTSMSTQGDLNRLINEGSSYRKLILTKFLDLDVFAKMHEIANKDAANVQASLRTVTSKDWEAEEAKLESNLARYDDFLSKVSAKLDELRGQLNENQIRVGVLQKSSVVSPEEIERCRKRAKHLESLRESHFSEEKKLWSEVSACEKAAEALEAEAKSYDLDALRATLASERSAESLKLVADHSLSREQQVLNHLQKSAKKLAVVPCGDSFPTCMFIKDSHTDKARLADQLEVVRELESQCVVASESLSKLRELKAAERLAAYEEVSRRKDQIREKLSSLKMAHVKSEGVLRDVSNQLSSEIEKLAELERSANRNENAAILELSSKISKLQGDVKKFEEMKLEAATSRGRAESELSKLRSQRKLHEKLTGDLKLYEMIASAFSKRGIPTKIINSQLPAINSAIAEILHGVVEYTVELEADEESNSLDIYLNYGDSRRIIELGSGMEKMFAALAIRVALWRVTSLPKTDIFIIDEGFGVLDDSQVEACNRLLVSLKKFFRAIIVITHVDAVKDIADSMIEITRNEKDSRVYVE